MNGSLAASGVGHAIGTGAAVDSRFNDWLLLTCIPLISPKSRYGFVVSQG
jgi:hypothetical protein